MAYAIFLMLHNSTRWLVLLLGMWALYRLATGWLQKRAWASADRKSVRWFSLILSLQFVFGAALYLYPGALINAAIENTSMAVIMKDRVLRFFTIEHPLQMFIAIGCSHVASFVTRRTRTDTRRFTVGTILIGLTLILILTAIPWPFLRHGRPLIRLP
jgi:hypothetical protein